MDGDTNIMKRAVLILTAVGSFALATMAQAESSVTLYGLVDTGYGYSKKTYDKVGIDYSNTSSGLHDSYLAGSRFGFRGFEDLGDGLRAIFVLESGINPSDGTTVTDR